jgi:hypothetical protein
VTAQPATVTANPERPASQAVDDGATAPAAGLAGDGWQAAQTHGSVRAVIPDHLTSEAAPEVDPQNPKTQPVDSLDDIPLYSTDAFKDPGRLLREVRAEFGADLAGLAERSWRVVDEFLDEKAVRSQFPLARGGGYVSPVLLDASGNPVGVLKLTAEVGRFTPLRASEKVMMENYLFRGVRTEGTVSVANGLDLNVRVEVDFTADHSPGHQDLSHAFNSRPTGRYDVGKSNTRTLGGGRTDSVAHSLKSAAPHFLSSADVHFRVTLVRPGHADHTHDLGVWKDAAFMRVHSKATAAGVADPAPRFLPREARELDYVGMSATTHKVTGTQKLFDRAQEWLTRNGFLPTEHDNPSAAARAAQLENYRRLAAARSDLGLRAGFDEMIDGGHSAWFDKPTPYGAQRLELRLGAHRAEAEPAHLRTVENVQVINFTNSTMAGTENFHENVTHSFGGSVSVGGPLRLDRLQGALAGDGTKTSSSGSTHEMHNGVIYEQAILSAGAQKLDVFRVPVRFTLDLHTESAEIPHLRFAEQPEASPDADGETRPWDKGHVELWVPEQRTSGTAPGPQLPARPSTIRIADDATVEALRTQQYKMPHSSVVDAMAGSRELIRGFIRAVKGEYSNVAPGSAAATGRPDRIGGAARDWLWRQAFGDDPNHAGSLVQQLARGAFAPVKLLANAHQTLDGVYATEFLSTSGLVADKYFAVTLEAHLGQPRLVTNAEFAASHHGGFPAYLETDVYAPDGTSLAKMSSSSHQGGVTGSLGWRLSDVSALTGRARYAQGPQDTHTVTDATSTQVNRVSAEDDIMFRFVADINYVLTVEQGDRNILANFVGAGRHEPVRLLITKPEGAQFVLTGHQVREHAADLGPDAVKLTDIPGALPAVGPARYLPERFRARDGIGLGAVTDVTLQKGRADFLKQVITTVEGQTPGVLTPGHAAYVPGLKSRLADYASPVGMRGLAGRGALGRQVLHYVYQHAGGAELVEVALTAVPVKEKLDGVIGHDLSTSPGSENGVETYAAHASGNVTETHTRIKGKAVTATVAGDHPGDNNKTFGDRTTLAGALNSQRAVTQSLGLTMENRTALRTPKATEFDVPYTYHVRISKSALDGTVINKLNQVGPGILRQTYGRVVDLWNGSAPFEAQSEATVKVRFPTTETTEAKPLDQAAADDAANRETPPPPYAPAPPIEGRLATQVHSVDPAAPGHIVIDMEPDEPQERMSGGQDTRQKPDPTVFEPRGDFGVHTYSAIEQLHTALGEVAPKVFTPGSRLWNSEENAGKQLTELLRRQTVVLRNDRGEFGLTSGHRGGADGEITITAKLSGMRRLDGGPVQVDRMRNSTTAESSTGATSVTPALSVPEDIHTDAPSGAGANVALLDQGRLVHSQTASLTANRRDIVKNEFGPRGASHEVRADLVLHVSGPNGQRWVTGTVYMRALDVDVLGRGLTDAKPYDSFFDLRSVYRDLGLDPSTNHQDPAVLVAVAGHVQANHPARAGEPPTVGAAAAATRPETVHLWLDLSGLDGSVAADAMFLAAHTARTMQQPVELSLRELDGVRHILLAADGSLQTRDQAAREAWHAFDSAAESRRRLQEQIDRASAAVDDLATERAGVDALLKRATANGEVYQAAVDGLGAQAHEHAANRDAVHLSLSEIDGAIGDAARQVEQSGTALQAANQRHGEAVTALRAAAQAVAEAEAALRVAQSFEVQTAASGSQQPHPEATGPGGRLETRLERAARLAEEAAGARKAAQALYDNAMVQIDLHTAQRDTAQRGVERLRNDKAGLEEQLRAAQDRLATAEQNIESAAARLNKAQDEVDRLSGEVARLQHEADAHERALDEARNSPSYDVNPQPRPFLAAHDAAGVGPQARATTTMISTSPALGGPHGRTHPFNRLNAPESITLHDLLRFIGLGDARQRDTTQPAPPTVRDTGAPAARPHHHESGPRPGP